MKKLKKVLLILALVALFCGISTVNYANDDIGDLLTTEQIPVRGETPTTPQETTPTPTTPAPTNTNNNTTSLPKTGVNDIGLWAIIALSVVSSVYAYKKIRDYNV